MERRNKNSNFGDFPVIPEDRIKKGFKAFITGPSPGQLYYERLGFEIDPFDSESVEMTLFYVPSTFLDLSEEVVRFLNPANQKKSWILIHGPSGCGKTYWGRYFIHGYIHQIIKQSKNAGSVKGKYYDLKEKRIKSKADVLKLVPEITGSVMNENLTFLIIDNIATLFPIQEEEKDEFDEIQEHDFIFNQLIKLIEEEIESESGEITIIGLLDSSSYSWLRKNEEYNSKVEQFLSYFRDDSLINTFLKLDRMIDEIGPFIQHRIKQAGGKVTVFEKELYREIERISLGIPRLALQLARDCSRSCIEDMISRGKDHLPVSLAHLEEISGYTQYYKLAKGEESILAGSEKLSKSFSLTRRLILKAMYDALGKENMQPGISPRGPAPYLVNSDARNAIKRVTSSELKTTAVSYYLNDFSSSSPVSTWPLFRKEGAGKGTKYTINPRVLHMFEYLVEKIDEIDDRLEKKEQPEVESSS
ncbi:MAG: AAA family ATPase [Candidatus Hodarchaeales archaeon]